MFYQHEAVQCQNVLSPQTDGANNSILMCWVMTLWIPVNLCINVWNNSKNTWSTGTGEGSGEKSFTVEKKKLLNLDLASLLAKLLILNLNVVHLKQFRLFHKQSRTNTLSLSLPVSTGNTSTYTI